MIEAVIVRPGVYVLQRVGPAALQRAAAAVAELERKALPPKRKRA